MGTTIIFGAACVVCGKRDQGERVFVGLPEAIRMALHGAPLPSLPKGWSWVKLGWESYPGYVKYPYFQMGPDAVCSEMCEAKHRVVAAVMGLGDLLTQAGLNRTWESGPDGECHVEFTIPPGFISSRSRP